MQQPLKEQAAAYAVDHYLRSGMVVGLGGGSTSLLAVQYLGRKIQQGALQVLGIPCSQETAQAAQQVGIPLTTFESHPQIDVTIDGADEVDPHLNLIKGGGGMLLYEKIVAQASRQQVIMVDEGKLVPILGSRWPLPVEVVPFGWQLQLDYLRKLGGNPVPRRGPDQALYNTDQGNYILDCHFGPLTAPQHLAAQLDQRAGIVAHGLFLDTASVVIVAGAGGIHQLRRKKNAEEL
jgi:ribose 5-phosphate isomerase A